MHAHTIYDKWLIIWINFTAVSLLVNDEYFANWFISSSWEQKNFLFVGRNDGKKNYCNHLKFLKKKQINFIAYASVPAISWMKKHICLLDCKGPLKQMDARFSLILFVLNEIFHLQSEWFAPLIESEEVIQNIKRFLTK